MMKLVDPYVQQKIDQYGDAADEVIALTEKSSGIDSSNVGQVENSLQRSRSQFMSCSASLIAFLILTWIGYMSMAIGAVLFVVFVCLGKISSRHAGSSRPEGSV